MTSPVLKRSIVLDGRKTSISIEEPFWLSLKQIARDSGMTLSKLVMSIRADRAVGSNLSSAIRVHILERILTQLRELKTGTAVSTAAAPMLRADLR